jgi:hypothetical protein
VDDAGLVAAGPGDDVVGAAGGVVPGADDGALGPPLELVLVADVRCGAGTDEVGEADGFVVDGDDVSVGDVDGEVDGVEVAGVLALRPPASPLPVTARPTLVPDSPLEDSGWPRTPSTPEIAASATAKPAATMRT